MKLPFFSAPLRWRLLYAALAALLWWPMVELGDFFHNVDEPSLMSKILGWSLQLGTGSVYSILVLVAYFDENTNLRWLRGLGLSALGALSYYLAVELPQALLLSSEIVVVTAVGGIIGVFVLAIPAAFILSQQIALRGWLALVGAGIVGGVVVGFGIELNLELQGYWGFGYQLYRDTFPGHLIWELSVCWAFYYGFFQYRAVCDVS